MEYGIQLYSLRDVAEHDLRAALAAVAKTGYKAVEFAGFFGHSAPEVRDWLAAYGLRVCGTHTPWQELTADALPATIAYHKALGNSRIIVPGADLSTREGIDAFVALANEAGPRLAAEGITLGYHNHTAEFLPNRDGLVPHDELAARTTLLFEIDKSSPEYIEAKRLLKFLDYFLPVPSEDIAKNSILREFIGGSCFHV